MVKRVITNLLLFRIIVIDIVVSVLVAGALTWLGIFTYDLAIKAENNASQLKISQVAQYQACLDSNRRAKADAKRWKAIVTLIDTMPNNPVLKKFIAGVEAANGPADQIQPCIKPKDV